MMWALVLAIYVNGAVSVTTLEQSFYSESICKQAGLKLATDLPGGYPNVSVRYSCVVWRDR